MEQLDTERTLLEHMQRLDALEARPNASTELVDDIGRAVAHLCRNAPAAMNEETRASMLALRKRYIDPLLAKAMAKDKVQKVAVDTSSLRQAIAQVQATIDDLEGQGDLSPQAQNVLNNAIATRDRYAAQLQEAQDG